LSDDLIRIEPLDLGARRQHDPMASTGVASCFTSSGMT
jgi:hypothetical protein